MASFDHPFNKRSMIEVLYGFFAVVILLEPWTMVFCDSKEMLLVDEEYELSDSDKPYES